jgi:hypothetical protein
MVITADAENYAKPNERYQVACLVSGEFWTEDRKAAMAKRSNIPADTVVTDVNVDKHDKGSDIEARLLEQRT